MQVGKIEPGTRHRNWAGNYEYRADRLHFPETVPEIQELAKRAEKVKPLGTGHSFNGIADSPGDLISLSRLQREFRLDREQGALTVDGGARYGDICAALQDEGFALPNLASLPHISIAGACATASHGSGDRNRNLATSVSGLQMVTSDGSLASLSREENPLDFDGMVVSLGGLGIVTELTLDIVPTFTVRQEVYENLSLAEVESNFDSILSSAYSVSLFTDWQRPGFTQVWRKRRLEEGEECGPGPWFGATLATGPLHPIAGCSAENCTEQMGAQGPWHERIPHFRWEFQPSRGEELQSEYVVPRRNATAAFHAMYALRELLSPLLLVSEVRTIAADNLWLSPCYRQDSVSIHFTWVQDWPAVENVLPVIEERLELYEARPHWGKLFTMRPRRVRTLFPKLPDFQRLMRLYDPNGKFRNPFLEKYIAPAA